MYGNYRLFIEVSHTKCLNGNRVVETSQDIISIFITMNHHQILLTSSLRDAIESDFQDITRRHLQFWKENIDLLDKEKLLSQPIFPEEHPLKPLFRPKRSGLQKILQVNTIYI